MNMVKFKSFLVLNYVLVDFPWISLYWWFLELELYGWMIPRCICRLMLVSTVIGNLGWCGSVCFTDSHWTWTGNASEDRRDGYGFSWAWGKFSRCIFWCKSCTSLLAEPSVMHVFDERTSSPTEHFLVWNEWSRFSQHHEVTPPYSTPKNSKKPLDLHHSCW